MATLPELITALETAITTESDALMVCARTFNRATLLAYYPLHALLVAEKIAGTSTTVQDAINAMDRKHLKYLKETLGDTNKAVDKVNSL